MACQPLAGAGARGLFASTGGRDLVSQELLKKIRQDPKNLSTYLLDAQSAIEAIEKKANGYDPAKVLDAAKDVYNQLLRNTSRYELKTGFDFFDEAVGGIPRKGLFGTIPGKSHHGKSVWMDNLINGLIETNNDIIVVLHTVDDPQVMRVQRLLGARTGIASKFWRSSGYFLHDPKGKEEAPENFEARFNEAWDWYFSMMKEERLIVVDSSTLAPDLMTLRAFLADIQRRHPGKTIIFFGDNFHLYDLQTQETGEQKISKMSVFVTTEIIGGLGLSAIFTVEIPKNDFEPGHRPSYQNLKGTGRLTFDSKVNMTIYSQTQDWVSRPDKQFLYWESDKHQEEQSNGDGITCMAPTRLPIVEVIIDKNKINGVTKTIFYRMDKFSGRMEECSAVEQQSCADMLLEAANKSSSICRITAAITKMSEASS
jgi:archaellum biogenesis ATPase FlaH